MIIVGKNLTATELKYQVKQALKAGFISSISLRERPYFAAILFQFSLTVSSN